MGLNQFGVGHYERNRLEGVVLDPNGGAVIPGQRNDDVRTPQFLQQVAHHLVHLFQLLQLKLVEAIVPRLVHRFYVNETKLVLILTYFLNAHFCLGN